MKKTPPRLILFLGLDVDQRIASFDSPHSRRVLRVAHETHNKGISHDLLIAEREHQRRPNTHRLHIDSFAAPSQQGFLSYYKQSPDDFVVREISPDGKICGSAVGPQAVRRIASSPWKKLLLEKKQAQAAMSKGDDTRLVVSSVNPSDVVAAASPQTEMWRTREAQQETLNKISGKLRTMLSLEQVKLRDADFKKTHRGEQRQQRKIGSSVLDDRKDVAPPPRVISDCVTATGSTRSPAVHSMSRAKINAWVSGYLAQHVAPPNLQTVDSRRFLASCASVECDGGNEKKISITVISRFSPQLSFLLDILGDDCHAALRNFVGGALRELSMATDGKGCSNLTAAIPWLDEQLIKVSHVSGTKFRDQSRSNLPNDLRLELRKTSKAQMKKAMIYIDQVWQPAFAAVSARLNVCCDIDYLFLAVVPAAGIVVVDQRNGNPKDIALARPNNRKVEILRPVFFHVVEFVLEKVGLPHSFVVQDLIDELALLRDEEDEETGRSLLSALGDASGDNHKLVCAAQPNIVVSHCGVIDSKSRSFQRIRVRGVSFSCVMKLAERLRNGDVLTNRNVAKGEAQAQHHIPIASTRPHLSISPKPLTPAVSSNSSLSPLTADPNARSAGRSVVKNRLNEAVITDEEREYWRQHFYKVHSVVELWTDAALPGNDADGLQLHQLLSSPRALQTTQFECTSASLAAMRSRCDELEKTSKSLDLTVGEVERYQYEIVVRRIPAEHIPHVRPAVERIQDRGFVNYFGPNRFGFYTHKNMHPGLHLLKGEYQAAATILVDPGEEFGFGQEGVDPLLNAKRRRLAARASTETALHQILRQALQFSPDQGGSNETCREVFHNVIGHRVCKMIVNEFLSFVWNDLVSQRVKRFGSHAVLPGDLCRKCDDSGGVEFLSDDAVKTRNPFDVLMPMPGYDVLLPRNECSHLIVQTMQRYGIPFNAETNTWDLFKPRDAKAHQVHAGTRNRDPTNMGNEQLIVVEEDEGAAVDAEEQEAAVLAKSLWRRDLENCGGNDLSIFVRGGYRHLLFQPTRAGAEFRWSLSTEQSNASIVFGSHNAPYWSSCRNLANLKLTTVLPSSVYPNMLLRELTKMNVNSSDVVDLVAREAASDKKARKFEDLKAHDRRLWEKVLNKKGSKSVDPSTGAALNMALLHQRIFRSGGMRRSLIPSSRGYDSITK